MVGKLVLSDGTVFEGQSFGADSATSGEVVFNTGMVGYPESLTDPSYFGQILVLTYPLIGNYGVPDISQLESRKIQIKGLIVQNYIDKYSHFEAKQSLGAWLKQENIPALWGMDTRELTRKLRHHGVMMGRVEVQSSKFKVQSEKTENFLPYVSTKKIEVYGEGKKHIILIDCGAKETIIKSFLKRKVKVTKVPWDFDPLSSGIDFDAVMISNGPGDPKQATATIKNVKKIMEKNIPIFGICLGNQILALAAGGQTYKLKFGHRSQNQPVQDLITKKGLITSQNHGFAVDSKKLPSGWSEWFTNLNDGTNEGIRHKSKPFMSVQFHPEATPGPTDAEYLFDEFLSYLK
ncbi:MAG: glutamine-hydrolyzing carbamoyl-phosphate synthase small subunit [Patescibacteria group bacterium]|nr:glutamine-hydrolyzing carbamoyl-phosphate synthase small subunit [Patescibacteria group bacterium]